MQHVIGSLCNILLVYTGLLFYMTSKLLLYSLTLLKIFQYVCGKGEKRFMAYLFDLVFKLSTDMKRVLNYTDVVKDVLLVAKPGF